MGIRSAADEHRPLSGRDGLRHDLRVAPAPGRADGEQDGFTVGQPLRPAVAEFSLRDVEHREALRCASAGGHT